MKILIVGNGQIGQAMAEIIGPHHEVHIRDVADYELTDVDMMHICFPDHRLFALNVQGYVTRYRPKLTLIHSSIGIGTTEKCGEHVVHVPIRGRHPHLAREIPAYPLFVSGYANADVQEAIAYLEGCNLVCADSGVPQQTELVKLLSNVHMGLEIAWRQEVERLLKLYGVSPLVYERWEDSYNEGYRITNNEQLIRPRLRPDPIGGHCILECTEILAKQYGSKAFEFIQESNETEKARISGQTREPATA